MKPKHLRDLIYKIVIVGLVLLVAPLAIPYAIELVVMLDLAGLEAMLMLLLLQSKPIRSAMLMYFGKWTYHLGVTVFFVAGLYMFQTDTYVLHTLGSVIILVCTCSLIAALTLWLPAIYLSHRQMRSNYITIPLIPPSAGTPASPPPH